MTELLKRSKLKPTPDPRSVIPTSVVLQRLHDQAPTDHFTLGWLMGSLQKRSFGIIMLLLALVAIAPGRMDRPLKISHHWHGSLHQGSEVPRRQRTGG